jgi:hypothetical protein
MQTVFLPLLADWDAVVPVVFFLIAFSSWIANFLKENRAGAGKKPVRPGPRPAGGERAKTIQEQIEAFLRQAREQAEAASSPPEPPPRPGEVEVVRQAPRRRAPSEKGSRRRRRSRESEQSSGQQNTSSPAAASEPSRGASRPGDDMAQRHLSGTLGSRQVSQDLGRLSPSTFGQQFSRDLDSSMGQGISSHLGTFQAGLTASSGPNTIAETRSTQETAASRVADLLRSRQTVRDALVISEILRKPRALS